MNWKKLLNNNRLRQSTRAKSIDARNDFESDFGRIIFSSAMRRMHDKTQVFPLTADDHIHSRLTHSMEVMAIGHSLGIRTCESKNFQKIIGKTKTDLYREIPVILKNACLVHDIGNPPFGHFGERVIQNYFKKLFDKKPEKAGELNDSPKVWELTELEKLDFTEFDGNAQGFRILTKLQVLSDQVGLNLTYATLGAYVKYPNTGVPIDSAIATKKHGVFQSEVDYLKILSRECGLKIGTQYVRHPLAYLMEAADSICYLVMDIEDGFNKGWYSLSDVALYLKSIPGVSAEFKRIQSEKMLYGAHITKFVKFRIYLIQRLVTLAVNNFEKYIDQIMAGEYNNELIFDDPAGLAEKLSSFCQERIFPSREITSLELTGHSVLTGLLDYYIEFLFHKDKHYRKRAQGLISDSIFRVAFMENSLKENSKVEELNDYYKLRVIVDYITGMTDQFALNHFQKLSGQKII